jgi:predicted SprT family Zn-dependent metalloprotease
MLYLLTEGVEGSINLKKLFKELNSEYFRNELPDIVVKWSARLKRAIGQASVKYIQHSKWDSNNIEIDMKSLKITVSKSIDINMNDLKAIMLHEMVHIYWFTKKRFGNHHDSSYFQNSITQLRDQSGLDIPYKESSFKISPKAQSKEGYLMLIYDKSGKVGASAYSKNLIDKEWLAAGQKISRFVAHSSKINKIELMKINHPIFTSVPQKRTFKSMSWLYIDDETVNDVRKKGKIFFKCDKNGGEMEPQKAGLSDKKLVKKATMVFGSIIRFERGNIMTF